MSLKYLKVSIAGIIGLLTVVLANTSITTGAEDETPTIKFIMQKSFGKNGYKASINEAAKGGKWDDANKLAKEWVALGNSISKNTPPAGEAKGWETNCTKFADATKAVLKATEDKDAKAVAKSVGGFGCAGCHDDHKKKK